MNWRIEVKEKTGVFDAVGHGIKKDIEDLGISGVEDVKFIQVYNISGTLDVQSVERICGELLVDRVSQEYCVNPASGAFPVDSSLYSVEVAYNPGVMDPVEESTLRGIRDLGIDSSALSVKTAKKYLLKASLEAAQLKLISEKLLYNKLIQRIVDPQETFHLPQNPVYQFKLTSVELIKASQAKLKQISRQGQLFLSLTEMQTIQDHYRKLGRNPTDCELETIAQTWSEHCSHKTFRGRIDYREKLTLKESPKLKARRIDNLLKSTIMKVTKELAKPWCVSVFKDNSGVIRFDKDNNVCFKVETHNHPSALEPFGGANTGIGGVIRDPLGTGLGARPFLNTDVFCFAAPDTLPAQVPEGCLNPKRVMKGVVSGVRDYGNKMGIPTVNGAVLFHPGFLSNPLVYCGTAGIMPRSKSFKKISKGDFVVVVGGKTGRDGIHGATFSSGELTGESEKISGGAVQIGDPIQEKKMTDAIIKARDLGLYTAITDCGAGGLSSAVGEMGEELGARVDLDRVPLKYTGLSYTEIWISESQERMVLGVPKNKIDPLMEVFKSEDVQATVIGEFTGEKNLRLFYNKIQVCDLEMDFLHHGLPKLAKKAFYVQAKHSQKQFKCPEDLGLVLRKLFSDYNICSKEWVIRQYDHEVQGATIGKPLCGLLNDGPSDASIVKPLLDSPKAVIVSNGINFRYGLIDPYWMAASCIDEALRQVVAVGGSLKQTAILDNFCWGNPDKPDRLGSLVRCAEGCYKAARDFTVPFISGKDSLYNEYTLKGKSLSIPGTLLISAISVMDDCSKALTMYAKRPGDLIYLVGCTFPELGGSYYLGLHGLLGASVPRLDARTAKAAYAALSLASSKGLVQAMHDCSDGGLAVAAAEMAFSGGLGMDIFLSDVPYSCPKGADSSVKRDDFLLFSESNSRMLVEVKKESRSEFERLLKGLPYAVIGCVNDSRQFTVYGLSGGVCLKDNIADLKEAWQKPLRW